MYENLLNTNDQILLADDDPEFRRIIQRVLEKKGFKVLQSSSGEEAIELARTQPVSLVLLDINMGKMNGIEVLQKLRIHSSLLHLPVIMLTGINDDEIIVKALSYGANDYITKPTDFSVALARIQTHLHIRHLEQAVEDQHARSIGSAKMLAIGELASGAAHEINNPLAIICGLASKLETALSGFRESEKTKILPIVEKIKATGFRISNIVNSIQTFATTSEKDAMIPVSVKSLIDDAALFCNPRLKNGDIGFLLPDEFPSNKVLCRPGEISRVMHNLLSNACDAVSLLKERWVRIDVESADHSINISVTDSGCGIAKEIQQKIFQPFFTTKPVGQGMGLGLSQALGIMRAHNGSLVLDPESANTRFVLQIPYAHSAQ